MRKHFLKFLFAVFLICCNSITYSQSYDFSAINQLLQDSSSLYLNRIYVEVFQNDSSIYQYQDGQIFCQTPRLGQGSATKWISSAIMLRLAEQGWWNLDDSIGTFLPVFTQYGKGHLTLRQSYSMSSGMYNPGNGNDYHKDPNLTLDQSIDSIAKNVQIMYPTGQMIGYDGTMMHVWGKAAEIVDSINGNNRNWRLIAKEEFFDLLQMDSTDYTDFLPNPAIAGGIETTPCDYLKFLKMLANNGNFEGSQILQPYSVEEMFTNQTNSAPIYYSYWPNNHPDFPNGLDTMRYTFGGWWSEIDLNDNIIGITSPGAFGHYPFVDRCRNLYGSFFCYIHPIQGGGQNVMNTFLKFMKILRDTIDPNCTMAPLAFSDVPPIPKVSIYPNPFTNQINVESEGEIDRVTLVNTTGQVILTEQQSSGSPMVQIQMEDLPSSIYFLIITEKSTGRVFTQKIIKL